MGVLIKGMTKPAHCDVCIFSANGGCIINRELEPDGELTHSCPLIEVPPHGDLIDRGKVNLTDFEIVMCNGDYKEGMKMLLEKIESAPIIIPAEPPNLRCGNE